MLCYWLCIGAELAIGKCRLGCVHGTCGQNNPWHRKMSNWVGNPDRLPIQWHFVNQKGCHDEGAIGEGVPSFISAYAKRVPVRAGIEERLKAQWCPYYDEDSILTVFIVSSHTYLHTLQSMVTLLLFLNKYHSWCLEGKFIWLLLLLLVARWSVKGLYKGRGANQNLRTTLLQKSRAGWSAPEIEMEIELLWQLAWLALTWWVQKSLKQMSAVCICYIPL